MTEKDLLIQDLKDRILSLEVDLFEERKRIMNDLEKERVVREIVTQIADTKHALNETRERLDFVMSEIETVEKILKGVSE